MTRPLHYGIYEALLDRDLVADLGENLREADKDADFRKGMEEGATRAKAKEERRQ